MSYLLKVVYTLLLLPILKLAVKARKSSIVHVGSLKVAMPQGLFNPRAGISSIILTLDILRILRKHRVMREVVKCADLCCGTGILGVTLTLVLKKSWCILVDVDLSATRASRLTSILNKVYHKVDVICTYGLACIRQSALDLVVTNPPYLPCPYFSDVALCCHLRGELLLDLLFQIAQCLRCDAQVVVALSNISPLSLQHFCTLIDEKALGPDKVLIFSCSRRQLLKFLIEITHRR